MKKPRQPTKHYPYREWEGEFMLCDMNINEFGKSKGLDGNTVGSFYRYVKKHGWEERRKALFDKASAKLAEKAPDIIAERWMEYNKVITDVLDIVKGKIGKMKKDGAPEDTTLKDIASILETLVKTKSFISGGPTERTENKSLNINLHAQFMDAIRKRDSEWGVRD